MGGVDNLETRGDVIEIKPPVSSAFNEERTEPSRRKSVQKIINKL